jgi:hypothetical protein
MKESATLFYRMNEWFSIPHKKHSGMSIICAYDNTKKLNSYLIQSLSKQTSEYELLTVDNTAGNFTKASNILNKTGERAKYDYIMFVHQDIFLGSIDWLENVLKELPKLPRLGAAGVAGKSKEGAFASVSHGSPPFFAGGKRLSKPAKVQTLDGCLIIVPKKIFKRISFDESTIEGWYLYAVDYCLDLTRRGYNIYVLPDQVYHESTGPGDERLYEKTLKNILEKHKKEIDTIYSTMGEWKTSTK